jgi:hypothetical protein
MKLDIYGYIGIICLSIFIALILASCCGIIYWAAKDTRVWQIKIEQVR